MRALASALVLFAIVSLSGCGSSTGTVTGKVTLNQKPVEGSVHFISDATKEERNNNINVAAGGQYSITGLKPGKYSITIKGYPEIKSGSPEKDKGSLVKPGEVKEKEKGEAPPPKYAEKALFTLEVKAGSQTYDMALEK